MLLVNARVGNSAIHGLGLIAQSFIAKGTQVSRFAPDLDQARSQTALDSLPEPARQTFRYYSFRHKHSGNYVLSFDDDRFMNHADVPNTNGRIALRDIAAGEDVTYDYRKWDLDSEWKLASTPSSFARSLASHETETLLAVLRVLAKVPSHDPSIVPLIAEALGCPDRRVRYCAAKSLATIGANARAATSALGVALKDADPKIRYYAAKCLAIIGPDARDAEPALIKALKDHDSKVRRYCAKALGRLRPSRAIDFPG